MALMDWLRPTVVLTRLALTPDELRAARKTYVYRRTWRCHCTAELTIRARHADRAESPSNFEPWTTHQNPRFIGHSRRPAGELTWDGLAHERGWQTHPVECPACQRGLTIEQYKKLRRNGSIP
jgi:hypothetical protein